MHFSPRLLPPPSLMHSRTFICCLILFIYWSKWFALLSVQKCMRACCTPAVVACTALLHIECISCRCVRLCLWLETPLSLAPFFSSLRRGQREEAAKENSKRFRTWNKFLERIMFLPRFVLLHRFAASLLLSRQVTSLNVYRKHFSTQKKKQNIKKRTQNKAAADTERGKVLNAMDMFSTSVGWFPFRGSFGNSFRILHHGTGADVGIGFILGRPLPPRRRRRPQPSCIDRTSAGTWMKMSQRHTARGFVVSCLFVSFLRPFETCRLGKESYLFFCFVFWTMNDYGSRNGNVHVRYHYPPSFSPCRPLWW